MSLERQSFQIRLKYEIIMGWFDICGKSVLGGVWDGHGRVSSSATSHLPS